MFTIITENDESKWEDVTGFKYHFPKRYINILQPGTKIVYYKGKLKDLKFKTKRLSSQPHYFGTAIIDKVESQPETTNYFATLKEYARFAEAVPFKINGKTIELIPKSQETNYWRTGVRLINEKTYSSILHLANVIEIALDDQSSDELETVYIEGGKKQVYTTVYERDKNARGQAIIIHGFTCQVCDFNFKETYGDWGEGYVHVHHKKPISTTKEKTPVNPKNDLSVVCANCHSMIHRKRDVVLKIEELKKLILKNKTK